MHESQRQAEYDRRRGSPASRGYGPKWRQLRRWYLKRHPLCADPFNEHMLPTMATVVDHIVPRRQGGSDDLKNLQPLCAGCHNKKTAIEDGRWG